MTHPSSTGIVVAPQARAAQVGADVLGNGGNAVDAAIACAFVQGLLDPHMGGVGGFGCMLVHSRAGTKAIEFHGRAGSQTWPTMFEEHLQGKVAGHAERYIVAGAVNQIGYQSIVVPGMVAGLAEAHRQFGSLPWRDLLTPAADIAAEGVDVGGEVWLSWVAPTEQGHIDGTGRFLASEESRRIFTDDGELWPPGTRLVQADYGQTLRQLAEEGPDALYRGELARRSVDDIRAHGGYLTYEDFATYRPKVSEPIWSSYRGIRLAGAPPPASSLQVLELLNLLEGYPLAELAAKAVDYIDLVTRAMGVSFEDRRQYLGDPDFSSVPIDFLLSKETALERRPRLTDLEVADQSELGYPEPPCTTHVSVVDRELNAVSLTHTLGTGSGVVTPGLGFTWNNGMYQFDPIPGRANSIEPGKARVTGSSPIIGFDGKRPCVVVGAPGGSRIVSAVTHTLLGLLDHGLSPVEAVSLPRFHYEGATLDVEPRIYWAFRAELERRGYALRNAAFGFDPSFARAQVATVDRQGLMRGGSDPRGGGGVAHATGSPLG